LLATVVGRWTEMTLLLGQSKSLMRIKRTIQKDFLARTPSIATNPAWGVRFASGRGSWQPLMPLPTEIE